MAESALGPLLDLPPAESRSYLVELARQEGAAALETLQLALEVPALAVAAAEALGEVPTQEAWDLLEGAAREQAVPALRKAARRAQHRLRSRGFSPGELPQRRPAPPVEQARASFLDFEGFQILRLVQPAQVGLVRYVGFIVGPAGLDACLYLLAGRADVDALLAEEDKRFGEDLVEMGLGYVACRVRQAVARSREEGQELPEDYYEAAALLEGAPQDIPEPDIQAAPSPLSPPEAERLLHHRSLRGWRLDVDDLAPYVRDWQHLLEIQPLRTPEGMTNLGAVQARGQMTARIIEELLQPDMLPRLAGQLREQALLLARWGEGELAGLALRAAAGLEGHLPTGDSFLRALVEESIELALQVEEESQEEEESPWRPIEAPGGRLWLPRPDAPPDEEEEPPHGGLWVPGS